LLFSDFLKHGEAMGLGRPKSMRRSRVHKASQRDRYTEQGTASSGHVMALCRSPVFW
jgi:hypothetical protein